MDIDVLRVSGETEWKRLEQLTRQRSLSGDAIEVGAHGRVDGGAFARSTPIPT